MEYSSRRCEFILTHLRAALLTYRTYCGDMQFLPVYEEIYHILETISLPRFLAAASANINRPKQLLWYAMGTVDTIIGVLLAILLIAIVPIPPAANRAWRLFSVLPASVGLSTIYSAYRG